MRRQFTWSYESAEDGSTKLHSTRYSGNLALSRIAALLGSGMIVSLHECLLLNWATSPSWRPMRLPSMEVRYSLGLRAVLQPLVCP